MNPNSYNLTLHNELLIYKDRLLDMKKNMATEKIIIPEEGYIIEPNKLYLGRTYEQTHTDCFVPMIDGRSSIGRLGLFVHVTAGFGDIGFDGTWTLELGCFQPIKIYPNIKACQISFYEISGDFELYKSSKYQHQYDIRKSKFYQEFEGDQSLILKK